MANSALSYDGDVQTQSQPWKSDRVIKNTNWQPVATNVDSTLQFGISIYNADITVIPGQPLRVITPLISAAVRGTRFRVSIEPDGTSLISTIEGQVESIGRNGEHKITGPSETMEVTANQYGFFLKENGVNVPNENWQDVDEATLEEIDTKIFSDVFTDFENLPLGHEASPTRGSESETGKTTDSNNTSDSSTQANHLNDEVKTANNTEPSDSADLDSILDNAEANPLAGLIALATETGNPGQTTSINSGNTATQALMATNFGSGSDSETAGGNLQNEINNDVITKTTDNFINTAQTPIPNPPPVPIPNGFVTGKFNLPLSTTVEFANLFAFNVNLTSEQITNGLFNISYRDSAQIYEITGSNGVGSISGGTFSISQFSTSYFSRGTVGMASTVLGQGTLGNSSNLSINFVTPLIFGAYTSNGQLTPIYNLTSGSTTGMPSNLSVSSANLTDKPIAGHVIGNFAN